MESITLTTRLDSTPTFRILLELISPVELGQECLQLQDVFVCAVPVEDLLVEV